MQRAASNIRTEANVLKDTVDGDGVADLAAQGAAERPIGDLSADELREKLADALEFLEKELGTGLALLRMGQSCEVTFRGAYDYVRRARREGVL